MNGRRENDLLPPMRYSSLGLVPIGCVTLQEIASEIEDRLGLSEAFLFYSTHNAMLQPLLGLLARGELSAIVDIGGPRQYRVPSYCWEYVRFADKDLEESELSSFSEIIAADCMIGDHFGSYNWRTACIADSDKEPTVAAVVAGLQADHAFALLLTGKTPEQDPRTKAKALLPELPAALDRIRGEGGELTKAGLAKLLARQGRNQQASRAWLYRLNRWELILTLFVQWP